MEVTVESGQCEGVEMDDEDVDDDLRTCSPVVKFRTFKGNNRKQFAVNQSNQVTEPVVEPAFLTDGVDGKPKW